MLFGACRLSCQAAGDIPSSFQDFIPLLLRISLRDSVPSIQVLQLYGACLKLAPPGLEFLLSANPFFHLPVEFF